MDTITLSEVLAQGISHEQYLKAVHKGQIIRLKRGGNGRETILDARSPYLLRRGIQNHKTASQ